MQRFLGSQSLPSLLPAALSLLLGLSKSSPLTLHLKHNWTTEDAQLVVQLKLCIGEELGREKRKRAVRSYTVLLQGHKRIVK